ncbi:hypothetical protein RNJ44_02210 [Nakaseomyces bracarensis]|uniref:Nucleoporin Nup159/Nup146 N-terminal domain-containing protein n=1 Tax=Nakaseomyces bracarensis TaxID=273131 RepID=A0ABR4NMS7_9SACH
MSSIAKLGPELETTISEDVGFKQLGMKRILPAYDGKLPLSALYNFSISNLHGKYAASTSNKVIFGEVQKLRDYILSDEEDSEFIADKEWNVQNVIRVQFTEHELCIISQDGSYRKLKIDDIDNTPSTGKWDTDYILDVKFIRNHVYYLDGNETLKWNNNIGSNSKLVKNDVLAFDISEDVVALVTNTKSVSILKRQNLEEQKSIAIPAELQEDLSEEQIPISINILSSNEFLIVFGNQIDPNDDEPMHDHKMYVLTIGEEDISYRESFDIAPAFSSVSRIPCYYNIKIQDLLQRGMTVNIIGSATSSELSVWDSIEVLQPAQDSDRAVFPISKDTDQDTTPVGIALDVSSKGEINQPCSGVDKIDALPLIYSLTNEGLLQMSGFFHVTMIKTGKFDLAFIKEAVKGSEKDDTVETNEEEVKSNVSSSDLQTNNEEAAKTQSSFLTLSNNNELPSFSQMKLNNNKTEDADSANIAPAKTQFGAPSFGSTSSGQNTFGAPSFGSFSSGSSTFGATSFGSSTLNNDKVDDKKNQDLSADETDNKVMKSQPANVSNQNTPAFGTPAFGKPLTDAPTNNSDSIFGKSAFGGTSADKPAESPFGKPAFGSAGFNTSAEKPAESPFGKPAFGSAGFNTSTEKPAESPFGKPAFGSTGFNTSAEKPAESPFGKPAFGSAGFNTSTEKPAESPFGKPAFGSTGFNTSAEKPAASPFGKPAFGSTGFNTSAEKPAESPFGKSAFGSTGFNIGSNKSTESPFAKIGKTSFASEKNTYDTSDTLAKLSSDSNDAFGLKKPLKFDSSPFSNVDVNVSPFAQLQNKNETEKVAKSEYSPLISNKIEDVTDIHSEEEQDSSERESSNNEIDEEVYGSGDNSEMPSTTNISELSDSTVEQTPFMDLNINGDSKSDKDNKSTISSLTEKIKQSAQLAPNQLSSPTFSASKNATELNRKSPFSSFANKINQPTSETPMFTFGKTAFGTKSSLNEKDANQNKNGETQTMNGSDNKSHFSSSAENDTEIEKPELPEAIDEKDETTNDRDLEEAKVPLRDSKEDEKITFVPPKTKELHLSDDKIAAEHSGSNISGNDVYSSKKEIEIVNEKQNAKAQEDKEISDNVADENLGNNIKSQDTSANIKEEKIPPFGHSVSKNIDSTTSTNQVDYCDFEVQAFEEDELYLSSLNKPEVVPEFMAGASIIVDKFATEGRVLQHMEKTVQTISAEIDVLFMNINNLDKVFKDQSTLVNEKTAKSFSLPQVWRLGEMEDVSTILEDELDIYNDLFREITQEQSSLSQLERDMKEHMEKKESVLADVTFIESPKDNNTMSSPLTRSQYTLRESTRDKMANTYNKLESLQNVLNVIKIAIEQANDVSIGPLLRDLTSKYRSHVDLLAVIENMKNQMTFLEKKDIQTEILSDPHKNDHEFNGINTNIAEISLELDTKKQIGQFFKQHNR